MKLLKMAMVAVAVLGIGARSANAIELRNEDTQSYAVTITSPAMSKDIESRALTLALIVCVGECEFAVSGVGTVRAQRDDIVSIKDGKVTTIPGPSRSAK